MHPLHFQPDGQHCTSAANATEQVAPSCTKRCSMAHALSPLCCYRHLVSHCLPPQDPGAGFDRVQACRPAVCHFSQGPTNQAGQAALNSFNSTERQVAPPCTEFCTESVQHGAVHVEFPLVRCSHVLEAPLGQDLTRRRPAGLQFAVHPLHSEGPNIKAGQH